MTRAVPLLAAVTVSLLTAATADARAVAVRSHGHAQRPTVPRFERPAKPALPDAPVLWLSSAETKRKCGDGANGCSDGVRVYVNTRGEYPRWTLAHELGHVADAKSMSDAERSSFSQLPWVRHSVAPDAGWWGYDEPDGHGHSDYFYGYAEVFADAFASCRFGELPEIKPSEYGTVSESFGGYGYDPGTNNRARRACARIARWVSTPR